ncbi:MAG: hypothetical protein HYY30_10230, partial [Chloroflexi bacterium]|nr:hypothetical protein [Chloroflexota bacterium]
DRSRGSVTYFRAILPSQGDPEARRPGLGLYITRLLVEAHSGRVWVESELGKGSTVYLHKLPRRNTLELCYLHNYPGLSIWRRRQARPVASQAW